MSSSSSSSSSLPNILLKTDVTPTTIQRSAAIMLSKYDVYSSQAVAEWCNCIESCHISQLLPLLYVANEVIQTSKRNRGNKYLEAFSPILFSKLQLICKRLHHQQRDRGSAGGTSTSQAFGMVERIRRVVKIWGDRKIYSVRFVSQLLKGIAPYRKGGGGVSSLSPVSPSSSSRNAGVLPTSAQQSSTKEPGNDLKHKVSGVTIEPIPDIHLGIGTPKRKREIGVFAQEREDGKHHHSPSLGNLLMEGATDFSKIDSSSSSSSPTTKNRSSSLLKVDLQSSARALAPGGRSGRSSLLLHNDIDNNQNHHTTSPDNSGNHDDSHMSPSSSASSNTGQKNKRRRQHQSSPILDHNPRLLRRSNSNSSSGGSFTRRRPKKKTLLDVLNEIDTAYGQLKLCQSILVSLPEEYFDADKIEVENMVGDELGQTFAKVMETQKKLNRQKRGIHEIAQTLHGLESNLITFIPTLRTSVKHDDVDLQMCEGLENKLKSIRLIHGVAKKAREAKKIEEAERKTKEEEERRKREEEEENKRQLEETLKTSEARPGTVWNPVAQEYQTVLDQTTESWRD